MANVEYLVQVFYGVGEGIPDWPDWPPPDGWETLPLWPIGVNLFPSNERPAARWARAPVACSDERWFVIGPFKSKEAAINGYAECPRPNLGFRVWSKHCLEWTLRQNLARKDDPWACHVYGDG